MWYEGVLGQKAVVQHLDESLKNNRIAHAQLFVGKGGSGTLQLALAYMRGIVAHIRGGQFLEEGDSSSINKLQKLVHPDVHFVFPVNKTQDISRDKLVSDDFIEHWRELVSSNPFLDIQDWYHKIGMGNRQGLISVHESSNILKKLSLKPFEGEYKVMLIWLPEKLHPSAANKLLKILEEPPQKTVFLLVSENPDSLLGTIVSRTQITRVPPYSKNDIIEGLINRGLDSQQAGSIAQMAHGDFRKALALINDGGAAAELQEEFRKWMRMCFSKKVVELLKWSERFSKMTREDLKLFLEYGLHLFRESLMLNYGSHDIMESSPAEDAFLENFSPYVNQANCLTFISEFEVAISDIGRNANAKILLFDLSIKVMQQIRIKPVLED